MTLVSSEVVRQQVASRVAALRELPYAGLTALPAWRTEDVPLGARTATVTTYRDARPDGVLEIVVQCMPRGRDTGRAWGDVLADGFLAHPDGVVEALPDAVRYFYM